MESISHTCVKLSFGSTEARCARLRHWRTFHTELRVLFSFSDKLLMYNMLSMLKMVIIVITQNTHYILFFSVPLPNKADFKKAL